MGDGTDRTSFTFARFLSAGSKLSTVLKIANIHDRLQPPTQSSNCAIALRFPFFRRQMSPNFALTHALQSAMISPPKKAQQIYKRLIYEDNHLRKSLLESPASV
jgi:hypothetical protein